MPSTAISIFTLVNLGPLTTTFTAPESCTTPLGIGDKNAQWFGPWWRESCEKATFSDCLPSGSARDEQMESAWPTTVAPAYLPIMYHSPGNVCPAGWETVGSVEKDARGNTTASWGFDPGVTEAFEGQQETAMVTLHSPDGEYPLLTGTPFHVMWADALEPEETGIACCPSGFTAASLSGCYSATELSEWTATEGCMAHRSVVDEDNYEDVLATVTAFDRTITGYIRELTATSALMSVTTQYYEYEETMSKQVLSGNDGQVTTVSTSREEIRAAMYYQEMLLLVAGSADEETDSESATGTPSAEASTAEESGEGGDESGAARRGASEGTIGMLLAACFGAMILGGLTLL